MKNIIDDSVFSLINSKNTSGKSNLIKAEDVETGGSSHIGFEEDDSEGVKLVLLKDDDSNIKEIKFICSCGQSKTLVLDYSE